MFRRLRIKFIAMSTGILILALVVVMGSVVGLLNMQIKAQVFNISELVIENGGLIPEDEDFLDNQKNRERFQIFNPEMFYETRYFTVFIDENGEILTVNDDFIRFINQSERERLALQIYNENKDRGIYRSDNTYLAYQMADLEDGSTIVVCIDCSSRYWILNTVFNYMMLVGGIVTVLFLVLMIVFSKKLIAPYVENDQRQKSFITNASHELKTPLAVISANTEMIEALNGESKWTDSTKRQVERLNGLIAAMVTLARSNEKEKEALDRIDLSRIVKDVDDAFEAVLISQGKLHNHDIAQGLHVKADPKTMTEIVNILIDNAVKYCDDKGTVFTGLTKDKRKKVVLKVSNTYAGHEDIDCNRFFDRFYREDDSHNSKKSGYGIGLSIAKEAVERMGGRIRAEYTGDMISFVVTMEEA